MNYIFNCAYCDKPMQTTSTPEGFFVAEPCDCHEVESMCVKCGSVPEKVTFCEERDADFCESCF